MTSQEQTRIRVLILADAPVAAELAQALLDLGYEALRQSATRVAEEALPDLVLVDSQSVESIAAAEDIVKRLEIPVVFLTSSPHNEAFQPSDLNAKLVAALHQHLRAQALFSGHTWLQTLLGSVRDGVIASDDEARIQYMNPVAEQLTGWSLRDAAGKHVREVFAVTTLTGEPVGECQIERALSARSPAQKERFLLLAKNGRNIPIEGSASPIREHGRVTGAVSIFLDATERLRLEAEAEELPRRLEEQVQVTQEAPGLSRSELRALSGHLMTVQEDERCRLARELHDDLAQRTAILYMQVSQILESLAENAPLADELLHRIRDHIAMLDRGLRDVSHRLHPSVLQDLGLIPAIRSLVDNFRDSGGEASVRLAERPPNLAPEVATAVYRIAEEALRNVRKHAPGAPVQVSFLAHEDALQLTIRDAGPGFDLAQARACGGLGLLSMQERARFIGGTLCVNTRPGDGACITVRVPLPRQSPTTAS